MGRAVYPPDQQATIEKLRCESETYKLQPHNLAAALLDNCRNKGDLEGMKFWRSVWVEIMDDKYLKSLPVEHKKPSRHPQLPGEIS